MDENEVFKVMLVFEVLYNCLFNDFCVYFLQNYNLFGLFYQVDIEFLGVMLFIFIGGMILLLFNVFFCDWQGCQRF